jgi:hypothetical protein
MKRHLFAGWSVIALSVALWPATGRAELKVAADNPSVTLGDTVTVRASGVPEGAEVDWTSTWELRLVSATGATAQFTATVQGAGLVSAAAGGQWGTAHITVTPPVGALGPVIPGAGRQGLGGDFAVGDLKKMQELLERYRDELGRAGLHDRFAPQAADVEAQGVKLPPDQAAQLGTITDNFFRELGGAGFALRDLQRYKNAFQGAANGGTPLFPGGNDWGRSFQGTERALMLGRATLVQQLWKETLIETLRENPRAGVFGEIDIGSWVKLQLGGLGFAADIDLSSVALDSESALNRFVRDRFEGKLRAHTSLDMIQADALLTAHGQATPDVFIGEWGKTFAELDMLKRSKWKLLRPKIVDGVVVDIISVERPGSQLFWEVAFQNGIEVKFPKMDLEKEPMLSLEMLRHGIHDIERGPYSRGQQLIKMLKYAERAEPKRF